MNVNNVTAGFTRFKWPIYGNCIHLYVWKSFSSGGPSICLPCCLYCFGQSCGVFSNENRHNVTPSQSTRMWPKLTFAKLALNRLPQTVWSNKHCRLGLQFMGFLCNLVCSEWTFRLCMQTGFLPLGQLLTARPSLEIHPTFTFGLVTSCMPYNIFCVTGFACQERLPGFGILRWWTGRGPRGTGSDGWKCNENTEGWNADFSFWCQHCYAALKSLSAVCRRRCGRLEWLWRWVRGGLHTCEQSNRTL